MRTANQFGAVALGSDASSHGASENLDDDDDDDEGEEDCRSSLGSAANFKPGRTRYTNTTWGRGTASGSDLSAFSVGGGASLHQPQKVASALPLVLSLWLLLLALSPLPLSLVLPEICMNGFPPRPPPSPGIVISSFSTIPFELPFCCLPRWCSVKQVYRDSGESLTWSEVLYLWQHDDEFCDTFSDALCRCNYQDFFWEAIPTCAATAQRQPFEFVVVDAGGALSASPGNPRLFMQHVFTGQV